MLDCVVGCSEVELVVFPIVVLVGIIDDRFSDDSDIIEGDIVGISDAWVSDRLDCVVG